MLQQAVQPGGPNQKGFPSHSTPHTRPPTCQLDNRLCGCRVLHQDILQLDVPACHAHAVAVAVQRGEKAG